ncbi:hypothetical protein BED47_00715 [Gottfriedia luciferensis]|uniref:Uncharacterized protein n=1 Tax=Gottfriedia luciferensis TaxID=178774 RepID=A0ABX2ZV89_9BACI|nr:DUF3908 family protein [Gottfriedia luciferensis]ODG93725.1 hypothetical protein BED47_00715 [Gottfriedia luciferensis]
MVFDTTVFKEWLDRRDFGEKSSGFHKLMSRLNELVEEKDIKFLYPKNLFDGKDKHEFIAFLENKLLLCTLQETEIKFQLINYSRIEYIEINEAQNQYDATILTIKVNQIGDIILNSLEDSNEHWVNEYSKGIKSLFKVLVVN